MKLTLKHARTFGMVTKGNSKIHGSTFSTDPRRCRVGSKLVKVEGSTCSGCYALRLAKVYLSAAKSWSDNLDLFRQAVKEDQVMEWCQAIAKQISSISANKAKKGETGANMHRWFTAGDLDSVDMLRAFVQVAVMLPDIRFWLPTREQGIVRRYKALLGFLPENLTIRISSAMVDSKAPNHPNTSTVHGKTGQAIGFNCPAQTQGGSCRDCSSCWDKDVKNISYKFH